MEDLKQYLTVPQVAEKLKKYLRAVKIGQWKVRPDDLETFIKTRRNY